MGGFPLVDSVAVVPSKFLSCLASKIRFGVHITEISFNILILWKIF